MPSIFLGAAHVGESTRSMLSHAPYAMVIGLLARGTELSRKHTLRSPSGRHPLVKSGKTGRIGRKAAMPPAEPRVVTTTDSLVHQRAIEQINSPMSKGKEAGKARTKGKTRGSNSKIWSHLSKEKEPILPHGLPGILPNSCHPPSLHRSPLLL